MFQVRNIRKLTTYPYRYVKISKQLAIKKPHKIHSNIKKTTLQCAPGIASQIVYESIISPIKSSTTEIFEHYIISLCLHTMFTTVILATLDAIYKENDETN